MKKFFLCFVIVTISIVLFGCGIIVTPFEQEMRKNIKELSAEGKQLKAATEEVKKELDAIKDETGKGKAAITAEVDTLRQDLSAIKGMAEEKEHSFDKIKENMELVTDALSTMDERIKEISAAANKGTGAADESLQTITKSIVEIKSSLESLKARVGKIEEDKKREKEGNADAAALYKEGLYLVREKKDYEKGLQVFQKFLTLFPDHELSDNAQYWIGEIYYAEGDMEKAIVEFNKVIKQFPESDKVPSAMLKQAYAFEKIKSAKEAKVVLERLIEKYPQTEEAKSAKKRLKELK